MDYHPPQNIIRDFNQIEISQSLSALESEINLLKVEKEELSKAKKGQVNVIHFMSSNVLENLH